MRDKIVRFTVFVIALAVAAFGSSADVELLVAIDRDRTVAAAVAAGNYSWSNSDINDSGFPSKGTGVDTVEIDLIQFRSTVTSDSVLTALASLGMRPADLEELLAIGEHYPNMQCQFPIVALGSTWRDDYQFTCVPCLTGSCDDRDLLLLLYSQAWSADFRFAAVHK